MRRAYAVLIIVSSLILAACATMQNKQVTAYKVLASTASLYDTSMKSLAALYSQGLITEEEKLRVIQAGQIFWAAWHEAETAVEIWFAVEDPAVEDRALELIRQLELRFSEMMEIMKPLLMRGLK